ncbi:MAG: DUF2341 domain-containing protein, partial [Promethearchaeota archaeon]
MIFKQFKKTKPKLIAVMILVIALMILPMISMISTNFITPNPDENLINNEKTLFNENSIFTSQGSSEQTWWNYSWQYRIPIDVRSRTGELFNYQVRIELNLTAWYQEGYLNETGKDIRFVNSTDNELYFWIENMNITGGNSTFWVRMPQFNEQDTTIFMYFGNANANTKSDIEATFINEIDGTRGAWHFEEGEGDIAYDTSGNNNNGTLNNSPLWDEGKIGSAINFSGGSRTVPKYMDVPDDDSLEISRNITFSFWLYATPTSGDWVPIFIKSNPSGSTSTRTYAVFWNLGSNYMHLCSADTSGQQTLNSGTNSVQFNQWQFWTFVVDRVNGLMRIYLDGVEQVEGSVRTTDTVSHEYSLSMNSKSYYPGNIKLDEVMLFENILTEDEITDLHDNRGYTTPNYPNKVLVRENASIEPFVSIGELEYSELNITCIDIDGRRVPNAEIYITNSSEQ